MVTSEKRMYPFQIDLIVLKIPELVHGTTANGRSIKFADNHSNANFSSVWKTNLRNAPGKRKKRIASEEIWGIYLDV